MDDITGSQEWAALRRHHDEIAGSHLRELFDADPGRGTELTATAADLYLDYSKHRVTRETLRLLAALAERAGLAGRIAAMFAGERVNVSENRPVLHVALRMPRGTSLVVNGDDVVARVHETLDRMGDLCDRLASGEYRGHGGAPIRTVVNIGIGGSDLGPAMAYEALRDYHGTGIECRFVSNVDPSDLADALTGLDPASTVFVVSSKTFTTVETLTNARVARDWLTAALGENAVARHFFAVSANAGKPAEFGITAEHVLPMWDWVGGRYSYDSAIGLSLMAAIGRERFAEMLAGMHAVDEHFRTAPFEDNVPVIQGMLGVWYRNFFGAGSHAVLPYSGRLQRFPAYLQQLTMESNGKRVRLDGSAVDCDTGEIHWGQPGTNGQHAFYQLLHQGTSLIPSDFLGFVEPSNAAEGDYDLFFANMLAQTSALAFGRTEHEVAAEGAEADVVPHKVMPATLGQLVALYEHTTMVKGVVWGIDSFDQWGVELGKVLAKQIQPALSRPPETSPDPSTEALAKRYRTQRGRQG